MRARSSSNQDVPCSDLLPIDFDRVRINECCHSPVDHHAGVDKQVLINAIQALDFFGLVVAQNRPVELALAHSPAETRGIFKFFGKVRAVDEELLRNTADVDTGAAEKR